MTNRGIGYKRRQRVAMVKTILVVLAMVPAGFFAFHLGAAFL